MNKRLNKILIFLLTSIFLFFYIISCKPIRVVSAETPNDTIFVETIRIDTVKVTDCRTADSLAICLAAARDSIKLYRDSIPYEDYLNARRIEKIKYYISICEKRSTNKKFFYGWIKRAVSE